MSNMFSKTEKNFSKNFTDAQVFEIVKLGEDPDLTWEALASKLNKKWILDHTYKVYFGIHRRFSKEVIELFHTRQKPNPHADFTRTGMGEIVKVNNKKKKKFVITSVGAAAELHVKGFKSLLTYCEVEGAELVLLPMKAHMKALQDQPNHFDLYLKDYQKNFATEFILGTRIKALELQLNPQQVNPLTGLNRIRGRVEHNYDDMLDADMKIIEEMYKNENKISLVIAHSKQMLQTLITGNDSSPRIMHTTGAITKPSYRKDQRSGLIATEDHDLGALIIEVNGDEFFPRQITINSKNGSFPSMGKRYFPDGKVKKERPAAFVMGDLHPGHECPVALKIWHKIWKEQKPKNIFLHDWFDGTSCSHWLESNKMAKAMLPEQFTSIQNEITYAKDVLYKEVADKAPKDAKLYLVPSNHPDFVERYLSAGKYMNDKAENFKLAHYMMINVFEGKHYLSPFLDPDNRYTWLKREDDIIIGGIQCNVHGDKSGNGAKGSKVGIERTYGKAMSGHTHEPTIHFDLFTVGHSSLARHGYNKGASSWVVCSGNIYEDGARELIFVVNGKYKF